MKKLSTDSATNLEKAGGRSIKKVRTGYRPRKLQKFLHGLLGRFSVLVCHRRFGKTVLAVNEIIDRALRNPLRNPHYAYVAPTYKQAKKVAWQYFVDYTRFLPGVKHNRTELTIYIARPNRRCPETGELDPDTIEITLIGADDPDSQRGVYLDGAVIDEFAQCDPIVWGQVLRPALADRKKIALDMGITHDSSGKKLEPWAIFIGTPKGQNHFYFRQKKAKESMEYCAEFEGSHDIEVEKSDWKGLEKKFNIDDETPHGEVKRIMEKWSPTLRGNYTAWRKYKTSLNWFTIVLKASETGVLDREEIDEMIDDMTPEEVDQELECSFTAAILGSYYGHLLNRARDEGRITKVPYNPKYPVDTYWDLGLNDKTGIWFVQKIGQRAIHYIDYLETNNKNIEELKSIIDAKANYAGARTEVAPGEFYVGRGFKYGRHVWPHDGAARDLSTGVSRQETARKLGLYVEIQTRQGLLDGIDASRTRLKMAYFDEEHCARGLECVYNYQREYDEKIMSFKNKPKHDWSSHGADGFRYSSLDDRPSYFPDDFKRRHGSHGGQSQADMDYDEFAA